MTTLEIKNENRSLCHPNWCVRIVDITRVRTTLRGTYIIVHTNSDELRCDNTPENWRVAQEAFHLSFDAKPDDDSFEDGFQGWRAERICGKVVNEALLRLGLGEPPVKLSDTLTGPPKFGEDPGK